MYLSLKKISILFFIASFAFLFVTVNYSSSCADKEKVVDNDPSKKEEFSKEVSSIKSLSYFKSKIKKEVTDNNISGINIPILIDNYIRKKFYHTTFILSPCNNWLLAFLDSIFPQYFFTTSLDVDDIMKNSFAACNQQSIVFQDIVKDYDFEYGSVLIDAVNFNHFASAVKFNNEWYFFDSNLEPRYDRSDPAFFKAIISADKKVINSMYRHVINDGTISLEDLKPNSTYLKDINKFPAKTGLLIQNITAFISRYAWIVLLFISALFFFIDWRKER